MIARLDDLAAKLAALDVKVDQLISRPSIADPVDVANVEALIAAIDATNAKADAALAPPVL